MKLNDKELEFLNDTFEKFVIVIGILIVITSVVTAIFKL